MKRIMIWIEELLGMWDPQETLSESPVLNKMRQQLNLQLNGMLYD